jgi:hypothetical protein
MNIARVRISGLAECDLVQHLFVLQRRGRRHILPASRSPTGCCTNGQNLGRTRGTAVASQRILSQALGQRGISNQLENGGPNLTSDKTQLSETTSMPLHRPPFPMVDQTDFNCLVPGDYADSRAPA